MLRQRAHRKEVAPKRAQKGECDKKAHRGESAPKSIQRRGRKKKRIDKRAQEIVPGEVRAGEVSGRGCMGILEYVLCCGRREEISEYCNRKLYKLEEYEHVLGTPLEDTLLAYYMNGFSVVKTAGALGIHATKDLGISGLAGRGLGRVSGAGELYLSETEATAGRGNRFKTP